MGGWARASGVERELDLDLELILSFLFLCASAFLSSCVLLENEGIAKDLLSARL